MLRIVSSALCLLLASAVVPMGASAISKPAGLQSLGDSFKTCLKSAVPPTAVHFRRSAAAEPCRQTELLLSDLQRLANRNRELACSGRLAGLHTDLLLISIYGGTAELAGQVLGRFKDLRKTCISYNYPR